MTDTVDIRNFDFDRPVEPSEAELERERRQYYRPHDFRDTMWKNEPVNTRPIWTLRQQLIEIGHKQAVAAHNRRHASRVLADELSKVPLDKFGRTAVHGVLRSAAGLGALATDVAGAVTGSQSLRDVASTITEGSEAFHPALGEMAKRGTAIQNEDLRTAVSGGAGSLFEMIPAILTGGAAGFGVLSAQYGMNSAKQSFEEGVQKGLTPNEASHYAMINSGIEMSVMGIFQKFAPGIEGAALGKEVTKHIFRNISAEIVEENITEFAQAANRVLSDVDPDALSPENIKRILIQTSLTAGIATGAVHAGQRGLPDLSVRPKRALDLGIDSQVSKLLAKEAGAEGQDAFSTMSRKAMQTLVNSAEDGTPLGQLRGTKWGRAEFETAAAAQVAAEGEPQAPEPPVETQPPAEPQVSAPEAAEVEPPVETPVTPEAAQQPGGEPTTVSMPVPASLRSVADAWATARKRVRRAQRQEPGDVQDAIDAESQAQAEFEAEADMHDLSEDQYEFLKRYATQTQTEAETGGEVNVPRWVSEKPSQQPVETPPVAEPEGWTGGDITSNPPPAGTPVETATQALANVGIELKPSELPPSDGAGGEGFTGSIPLLEHFVKCFSSAAQPRQTTKSAHH